MSYQIIDAMFDRHEPRMVAATGRDELLEAVLDLHADVARHWAEASWLRLTQAISNGDVPVAELWPRLEDACVSLFKIACAVHARHGLDDRDALKRAAERIADEFFRRIDEVAAATAGQWGRA